jgi:hypothetical protein
MKDSTDIIMTREQNIPKERNSKASQDRPPPNEDNYLE